MNTLKSVAAALLVTMILGAMACGAGEPAVTQIVVEVTSTPEPTLPATATPSAHRHARAHGDAGSDLHAATDLHPIADSHAVPNVDASPDADRNSGSPRDAHAKSYANPNTASAS